MAPERRKRKTEGVPVLKLPPRHLRGVLDALRSNEFDRDGFRIGVMELFEADKDEKSVFRGMAVPTLRSLGLMAGFDREMRLTANGSIVGLGLARQPMDRAPLAVVLQDIESRRNLDRVWRGKPVREAEAVDMLIEQESAEGKRAGDVAGRVRRWLGYLEFAGLLERRELSGELVRRPRAPARISKREFAGKLRDCYRTLSPRTVGEAIVPVEDVRRCVAQAFYADGRILISSGFDACLERLLIGAGEGVFLHRSMGADEALFVSQGVGYSSLSIRGHR